MTYPGAIELIHGLAKQKVPLALVTGSLRSEAEIVLKTFDIAKYFTKVITAEDTTLAKPNPEGYLKAAVALECDPTDCIVIEDSPNGVRAARAAGMKCLAVTTTHLPDELSEANSIVDRLRPGCLNSF
jgi:sugar-phosphatase